MNFRFKDIQASFAIHAAVFALFIFLGGTAVKENRPIVIDFSVQSEPDGPAAESKPASKRVTQPKQKKAILPEPARASSQDKKEIDLPPQEEELMTPSLSENHALVAALPAPSYGIADKGSSESETAFHSRENSVASSAGDTGIETSDAKSDYLRKNFSYIQDIIQRNISYPVIARQRGWEGRVTVSFVVCIDGQVKNIILEKASGIGLLDRNAVETVRKTSPFPRPPLEAKVVVPIVYTLH